MSFGSQLEICLAGFVDTLNEVSFKRDIVEMMDVLTLRLCGVRDRGQYREYIQISHPGAGEPRRTSGGSATDAYGTAEAAAETGREEYKSDDVDF